MNFFDAQDKARRATRWLVVIYFVATLFIVMGITALVAVLFYSNAEPQADPPLEILIGTAVITVLFILAATLYKTSVLSSGGGRVALDMGGTLISPDVQDPLRQRLRNVVEEMAIASGIPVPEIYVLEEESGINAFAAGFTPGDAAVAVTRGCLELLDRDELQGVIAHEFSHILNGDMRLNIRMMGVLFGIMVIGIIGRFILRSTYYGGGVSSRKGKGLPVVLVIGLGLTVLGWIGVFFARMIKAAVSRQREFLADASAVQFTRQTDGLANALKKIGGYSEKSFIQRVDPEEVSHMLFAGGAMRLTAWFATHPPLIERITALDPGFNENSYPVVNLATRDQVTRSMSETAFSGTGSAMHSETQSAGITGRIAEAIGKPEPEHVLYAQQLRSSMPAALYKAAHQADEALLLAIALSLGNDQHHRQQQLTVVAQQIGDERANTVREYALLVSQAGPALRLPLLEIAFPMLRKRPIQQIEFLLTLVRKLMLVDNKIDLGEFCYYRILHSQLRQAVHPAADKNGNRVPRKAARRAAVHLIRVVADQGNSDRVAAQKAFAAGTKSFGGWAVDLDDVVNDAQTVAVLEASLDVLNGMNSAGRQSLLQAVSTTVSHDGKLTITEAELLRAICAALHCPLPPILAVASHE